jgi:hypothetical protein
MHDERSLLHVFSPLYVVGLQNMWFSQFRLKILCEVLMLTLVL